MRGVLNTGGVAPGSPSSCEVDGLVELSVAQGRDGNVAMVHLEKFFQGALPSITHNWRQGKV